MKKFLSIPKGRHLLSLKDFQPPEICELLRVGHEIKLKHSNRFNAADATNISAYHKPLSGESLAMLFQKRSTRTRVSCETGFSMLGGHALFLGSDDIQLGVNESIIDSTRVLSRFNSIILARVFGHEDIVQIANESSVPVINALSDKYHPLQILADLMTLQEHMGKDLSGLKVAWVGDGNNILHSLMVSLPKLGIGLSIATPAGYEPDNDVMQIAKKDAEVQGTFLEHTTDPLEAVSKCDVVVTDTWVSMGQEDEAAKRLKDFEGYQVTKKMMKNANADWRFLHCLPRKPYEVDDDVFYDNNRSLVWDEAENRMWSVMAVFMMQLRGTATILSR